MNKEKQTKTIPPLPLPGEPNREDAIASMIRVDHAGEFGAKRIYKGQMDILGPDHPSYATIKHMAEQEDEHLEAFEELMMERGVRPTALYPFWNVAGYTLGAVTAIMGEKAAMACTAAVEEVIDEHYQEQRETLSAWNTEPELNKKIEKFQAEEVEHKNIALEHGAEDTPGYKLLSEAIKIGCRSAIWLSKRV